MNRIHLAAVAAASVVTLAAAESRADEVTTTTTTQAPVQTPAAPVQTVQTAPVQTVQTAPVQTTQTTSARYVPGSPAPDTYQERRVEALPNRPLLSAGGTLFVLSYGASVVTAAVSDREADKNLFIPVAGPWIDLADRGCETRDCGSREGLAKAMLITSGVVQGAGVLLAVGSLFIPQTVEEKRVNNAAKPTVRFSPASFGAGAGAMAVGTF